MKNNLKIILSSIGIAILVALMGTATYAYFTLEIEGVGKNNTLNTFNKNMEITYTETSNVTLENAYTGDSVTKTFTVKNTGNTDVYYNVVLENVVNDFAKPEELQYTISETNDAAWRLGKTPTSDDTLLSDIKIKTGETHTYTLEITFIDVGNDQSYNMNKTFSGKINVVPSENSSILMNLKENSLTYKIMNSSDAVIMKGGKIDFLPVSNKIELQNNIILLINGLDQATSNSNKLYYTNYSENGRRIFLYYGDNTLNNNVLFGGYCWKIIRTTETAGLKMIYNGVPTNGACTNATGDAATIGNSVFNTNASYNAYVGYMYGTSNSSTYAEEHKNTTNSTIKTMLENWYANNLLQYNDYIEDTTFCNDRRIPDSSYFQSTDGIQYTNNGFGSSNTLYYGADLDSNYICHSLNDKFSVKRKNNAYPIGLIDVSEMLLAGVHQEYNIVSDNSNSLLQGSFFNRISDIKLEKLNNAEAINGNGTEIIVNPSFLISGSNYWTMTSAAFIEKAQAISVGSEYLKRTSVDTSLGVRPVIALKSTATVISGDGSLSSPYKITE